MVYHSPRFTRTDLFRFLLLFGFLVAFGALARADGNKKKTTTSPSDADIGAPSGSTPTFPSLQAEMDAHHLADDLLQARLRLADLESRRSEIVAATHSLVKGERQGLALLKRYQKLVTVRYSDEDGNFNAAAEVSGDDVTNLNQLFDHYLHQMPFAAQWGRISAGFARDSLKRGIDQLEEVVSAHRDPDPDNNPELEMLAYQMQNEKDAVDHIMDVADSRGIKLDPKAPLPEGARVPAASE